MAACIHSASPILVKSRKLPAAFGCTALSTRLRSWSTSLPLPPQWGQLRGLPMLSCLRWSKWCAALYDRAQVRQKRRS